MGRAFEFRKERKMKRWAKMSKTFTRLGKDLVIAVKSGGPDLTTNSKLRAVIQNCKTANMPKDNIARAIKKASDKNTADYKEILFEGYAPHGIAVLVETATDNNNRTVANIRNHFNKHNGHLGTAGSVEFLFEHKCQFTLNKGLIDIDELALEMIDFGAEDVFEEEDNIILYGNFSDYGILQKALEEQSCEIISTEFERIPTQTKKLSSQEMEEVEKLFEKLEGDDDVQNIFHTME